MWSAGCEMTGVMCELWSVRHKVYVERCRGVEIKVLGDLSCVLYVKYWSNQSYMFIKYHNFLSDSVKHIAQ